jgi:LmbE family N-acetylglucosaminyl deacetylase
MKIKTPALHSHFWLTLSLFFCLNTPSVLTAQVAPRKASSADIFDALKKLNTLGSVLYVAAHPDDENTRMISYFANARHMDVTYLSLTRGDGGQNLIGTELREMLGVLRTQELLMARHTDGGKQLFSRANDFGFSKSPAETFRFWGKDEILSDVVWAMRKVQPDIIINRFSIDTSYDTHGHHTGSAIMSYEAFDKAGDPSVYPEQLAYVPAYQPRRLFHNISWFWFGSQEKFNEYIKREQTIGLDAGVFLPTKGKSNDEIAAESRSMHKCQAMGMMSSRGSNMEYLQYLKGAKGDDKPTKDPFEGINTSWSRLGTEGVAIGKVLEGVEKNFRLDNPAASVAELLKARTMIQNLAAGFWRDKKLAEIERVILACAGIYLEASANQYALNPNSKVEISFEAINRSTLNVELKKVQVGQLVSFEPKFKYQNLKDSTMTTKMESNKRQVIKLPVVLTEQVVATAPYWLKNSNDMGRYTVKEQILRGLPETPRSLQADFELVVEGQKLSVSMPIVHIYANPAKGEIYRPVEITPSVFASLAEKVYVFGDQEPKEVSFVVRAGKDGLVGLLKPSVPKGWILQPESQKFSLKQKGEETVINFQLTPPKGESEARIEAKVFLKTKADVQEDYEAVETKSVKFIEYDHIPTQTVLQPAEARIVKLNIAKRGTNIGYVMGAGDDMPACLEQIGYQVSLIKDADFQHPERLQAFDAIVVGIRAYNIKEKLKFQNEKLLKYVENGGTMIVQYMTTGRDLSLPQFGPYPFKLGRGRTTEEDAEVRFLKPEHPVLNMPNKITKKDFEGWVQERGLYFLSEWDKSYEAILSCNDVNEKAEDGGLMIAKHGKGWYAYTGYSFFRELPAGVSGAYRLFANLLSLGKSLP